MSGKLPGDLLLLQATILTELEALPSTGTRAPWEAAVWSEGWTLVPSVVVAKGGGTLFEGNLQAFSSLGGRPQEGLWDSAFLLRLLRKVSTHMSAMTVGGVGQGDRARTDTSPCAPRN